MPSSSSSHQLSASLLRGLSPSRTASGLMRRNSASSETSSVGGGGTEPRHGSLTERLGRLTRRRSSHSGELMEEKTIDGGFFSLSSQALASVPHSSLSISLRSHAGPFPDWDNV